MDKIKRTPMIAGNWKMNLTGAKAGALIKELRPLCSDAGCEVVVCPAFTALETAAKALKGSSIKLGAQNCHWEQKGAFTGEISAEMLGDIGAAYVIIGHSERRQYFGETDETAGKRLRAALEGGLRGILCVGETLEEKDAGQTTQVIYRQLTAALAGVSTKELANVVIAYEPVWAIGTGKTATPELAGEVCGFIRGVLTGVYDMDTSYAVRVLYGGSMNAANAKDLLAQYDIDGGLIGSASLKAGDFAAIVAATRQA